MNSDLQGPFFALALYINVISSLEMDPVAKLFVKSSHRHPTYDLRRLKRFSARKGSALYLGTSTYPIHASSIYKVTSFDTDHTHVPSPLFTSINAVGVDIAPFSAMPHEEEVLLLPGLPLTSLSGENPEPDLWTFAVETPGTSGTAPNGGSPPVMIDYVHPGACDRCWIIVGEVLSCCQVSLQVDLRMDP